VAWTISLFLTACEGLTGGDRPVAIEFVGAPESVAVGERRFVPVRVLNGAGDSIPGARIVLTSLNPDTLAVDSAAQSVVGIRPGAARIVAAAGSLVSHPFRIVVTTP
jgi:hypothetical protein